MTPEQFNAVFRAHLGDLSRFLARRMPESQVEDLAADLFELAWQKRSQIPEGLEMPWLYKSARYLISNQRRKDANRSRIMSLMAEPASAPSAESIALADYELGQAWGQLKPSEREVLALWAMDGLTAEQIAPVLEISENAVAIRISRAKKSLQEILTNSENISRAETSN